jgi:phospholipase C
MRLELTPYKANLRNSQNQIPYKLNDEEQNWKKFNKKRIQNKTNNNYKNDDQIWYKNKLKPNDENKIGKKNLLKKL